MPTITKVFAGLAGLIHVMFFVMESLLWLRPAVYETFLVNSLADAEILDVYVKNQGYYNLFLALGMFAGLAIESRNEVVGKTLVGYISAVMIGASLVLLATLPEMFTGFVIQGLPPAIALGFLLKDRAAAAPAD